MFPDIVGLQIHLARQQAVMTDKFLQRLEYAIAQAGLVSAAQRGRDQVDIRLTRPARLAPGQRPGRTLALGKTGAILGTGIALTGKYRTDIVVLTGLGQGLVQVGDQAVGILPNLLLAALLVLQDHLDAGQQHRLGAQESLQLVALNLGTVEIFAIRPGPDQGAGGTRADATGYG